MMYGAPTRTLEILKHTLQRVPPGQQVSGESVVFQGVDGKYVPKDPSSPEWQKAKAYLGQIGVGPAGPLLKESIRAIQDGADPDDIAGRLLETIWR